MHTEEGLDLTKSATKVFLTIMIIAAVVSILTLCYNGYNQWYAQQAEAKRSIPYKSLLDMSSKQKVPISALLSSLQTFEKGDIYALSIDMSLVDIFGPSKPEYCHKKYLYCVDTKTNATPAPATDYLLNMNTDDTWKISTFENSSTNAFQTDLQPAINMLRDVANYYCTVQVTKEENQLNIVRVIVHNEKVGDRYVLN